MAENYLLQGDGCSKYSSLPSELDIPIKSILIMHDPDGRELDSEMLLRVIEAIMHHTTDSQQDSLDLSSIEVSGPELDSSIYMISSEILSICYGKETAHESTLDVLSLLGSYRWDAKLVLALSAFATLYGQLWVNMQSKSQNPLAASIALLKQFPDNMNVFKPVFVALTQFVNTVVEVIRSIMLFESLPINYVELPGDVVAPTKQLMYVVTYWVVKSITVCISLIINLRATTNNKHEDSYSVSSAIWEIRSLKSRISSIGNQLRAHVDICQRQTETEMDKKLTSLSQRTHIDNQEVLHVLFALKNDFPLKQSSEQAKVGITALENQVVILLFSKPDLLPIEELLLLVQQTYDHPNHGDLDGSYAILWIPISASDKWSNNEVMIYNMLSNSLPWHSIRQPWLLSSTTIKYAKQEWGFNDKPVMVVVDSLGKITNPNAADMLWIWGAKAYPFSTSKEKELWKEEKWCMRLLLDNIDPLLNKLEEEGRTICIYSSSKIHWIRGFSAKMKDIQSLVPELEVVYVGIEKGQNELETDIVSVIEKEKLSKCLTLNKIHLFWHRIQSMRRSKLRFGKTTDVDHILREIEVLLNTSEDVNEEWIIMGRNSSTNLVRLQGNEWAEFLGQSATWKSYLQKIGLVNAIRLSLEPPAAEPCSHPRITRDNEGLVGETSICETCKHFIKKLIIYDAEQIAGGRPSSNIPSVLGPQGLG